MKFQSETTFWNFFIPMGMGLKEGCEHGNKKSKNAAERAEDYG